MTFRPDQLLTTEAWLKKHAGHTVEPFEERVSIKIMRGYFCYNCRARHLDSVETVGDDL